ncbi:MAG: HPr-rel-A system PqqD family peptide chaperone, partial [Thermoguttaceae bacterium]|nr:HPr-rel-A system PqqD family peptide chaperone [Thermoguttaceae bacterium]
VSMQFKDGDETIIYHEASGSIHLINELGVKILNAISERPLTLNELVDAIHAREINTFESVRQFLKIGVEQGFIEEIPENETK